MRNVYLGIDTSNYTTSTAVLHERDKSVVQQKKLLPVKQGELGLRQSDAVFHHTQQIPDLLDALWKDDYVPKAVGVSVKPRDAEGSYMPCFSVGTGIAKVIAKTHGIPLYSFSHRGGHIGAALYGAGRLDLLSHPLIAFHVSGGTTEAVLVRPDKERIFTAEIVSCSLDLKGGQAVDRVGVMLGLSFPAGKELEQLALQWKQPCKVKASVKGQDFSLSGIENQCKRLLETGHPKEEIARFCLDSILAALDYAAQTLLQTYGNLPLLFAGGVMSNSIIRQVLTEKYGACFAPPEYSADNAAGIAVLTAMKEGQL